MKKLFLVGAIIIGMLAVSGFYSHGNAGVIYGCAKKNNGQFRIVSKPSKCLKSEKPITLNQPDYQELCMTLTITEDENGQIQDGPAYLMKFGVTKTGGPYNLVQGHVEVPEDNPLVLNGSAETVGNEIFVTLSGTQEHIDNPWRDTALTHMRLDKNTLNGTLWGVNADYDTSAQEFSGGYIAGTVTSVTCP